MLTYLLLSLSTRLLGFATPSLWYDEAVSKYRASLPWLQYLHDTSEYVGVNLWEIVLRPFAYGPVWLLRIPALACAMLAIYLTWRLMDRLQFTKIQRYTTAAFLAVLPGLIWIAQDARYYAALAACYMGALWFAMKRSQLGLIACVGLAAYVHPVGAAYGVAALLIAWIAGMSFKRVFVAGVLSAMAWIPRYVAFAAPGILPRDESPILGTVSGEFWLTKINGLYVIEQTIQAVFVNTIQGWLLIFIMAGFVALVIAFLVRIRNRSAVIVLCALFIPAAIMLFVSFMYKPVYFYRPIQPLCYALCLFVALAISPGRTWYTWIGIGITSAVLLVSFVNYDPETRGGHIEQTAAVINKNWQAGDKIVYVTPLTAFPFSPYLPDRERCILDMPIGLNLGPLNIQGYEMCPAYRLAGPGRVWLVWSTDPAIPENIHATLRTYTAGLVPVAVTDAWQFATIEVYLLNK
jgi:hypothetical protein